MMAEKPYILQTVEKREKEIVFWVGHGGGEKPKFGFIFDGAYNNIARQETVESILLGWQFSAGLILNELKTMETKQ